MILLFSLSRIAQADEGLFRLTPSLYRSAFLKNNLAFRLCSFCEIKQEGTGQVLFFPLALRGKAFGFSALCQSTVITLAITRIDIQFYLSKLDISIAIK